MYMCVCADVIRSPQGPSNEHQGICTLQPLTNKYLLYMKLLFEFQLQNLVTLTWNYVTVDYLNTTIRVRYFNPLNKEFKKCCPRKK